jgi:hypothetical protein
VGFCGGFDGGNKTARSTESEVVIVDTDSEFTSSGVNPALESSTEGKTGSFGSSF